MNSPNCFQTSSEIRTSGKRFHSLGNALALLLAFLSPIHRSYGQAPVIVTQPASQDVSAGSRLILNVEASGREPFSYQWSRNGVLLQGSNQQSMVFASVTSAVTATYSVKVVNAFGATASQMARLEVHNLSASIVPIALEGWDSDVILEDSAGPLATADFDTFGAYWFEAGLAGHDDGLPVSRRFTSQFNTNVMFQLQSYEANNVLRLQGSAQTNNQGTLTLITPGPYRSLAILASCGGMSGFEGKVVLAFADGTARTLTYTAHDWSAGQLTGLAIGGLGRYRPSEGLNAYQNQGRGVGMYETDINLTALGLDGKALVSLTFTKANDSLVTGIFAVSGQPNRRPQLQVQVLPDKRVVLKVSGFPQTVYRIDTSLDLVQWAPLAAVASGDGISRFTNAPPANQLGGFYRVGLDSVR